MSKRTVGLNADLLALGNLLGRTLRENSELGLIGEAKISLEFGFWATLRHDETRMADALMAWFALLTEPVLETQQGRGVDYFLTHVFVRGLLDGVRMSVLATFTGEDARREFGSGAPTVDRLRQLQLAGAQ